MKRLFTLLALFMCLTANAQRLLEQGKESQPADNSTQNEINMMDFNKHLNNSGKALKTASYCDVIGFSSACASLLILSNRDNAEIKANNSTIGIVLGGFAVLSKILAVSYRHKSGVELSLAAGAINVTF